MVQMTIPAKECKRIDGGTKKSLVDLFLLDNYFSVWTDDKYIRSLFLKNCVIFNFAKFL